MLEVNLPMKRSAWAREHLDGRSPRHVLRPVGLPPKVALPHSLVHKVPGHLCRAAPLPAVAGGQCQRAVRAALLHYRQVSGKVDHWSMFAPPRAPDSRREAAASAGHDAATAAAALREHSRCRRHILERGVHERRARSHRLGMRLHGAHAFQSRVVRRPWRGAGRSLRAPRPRREPTRRWGEVSKRVGAKTTRTSHAPRMPPGRCARRALRR